MKTVVGVFADRNDADSAVKTLESEGYKTEDMSVVVRDQQDMRGQQDNNSDFAENTTAGAVAGGAVGGLAGLLIGVGAIAIPGLGAFLIAGPIAAALGLTGAAATTLTGALTGVLAGGLIGALTSLGIPEKEARYYEERVREGAVLLLVNASGDSDVSVIEDTFNRYNAEEVRSLEPANA